MNTLLDWLPMVTMMLATGIIGGVLAGLLGVGGGIVIVPVLDAALGVMGVDPSIQMHVAVATSLATIVPTSLSSTRAHHRKGAVDFAIIRLWGPFILIGSVAGVLLAGQVEGQMLAMLFGVISLLVAIKMMMPLQDVVLYQDIPRHILSPAPPLVIGTLSSMVGIGGGAMSVPVLALMNQPIHRAVGTAAFFGLLISLPATVAYIISGLGDPRLPFGSLGYVSLLGFALISPMTVLMAPFGAKIAHRLDKRQLSVLFGVFLTVVAMRMLYRGIVG